MKKNGLKITRLKKEIEVKDFIIKELIVIITKNKIKVPDTLMKNIKLLYATPIEKKDK